MKWVMLSLICSFSLCQLVGCGEPTAPADAVDETAAVDTGELKTALQEVANTGVVSSGLAGAEETIKQMSDAAKKESLLEKYAELMSASKESDVKRIANEMASEL